MRLYLAICICIVNIACLAQEQDSDSTIDWRFGGHAKYQFLYSAYPDNSIFQDVFGTSNSEHIGEARLKAVATKAGWDFNADYQFIAIYSDALDLSRQQPLFPGGARDIIDDDRRWFDLTDQIVDQENKAVVQRLDRLSLGYTSDQTVWRFGRQAITWGNGMVFTPMDVFNPFDPAAIDKEYKSGDDMLYGQYLFTGGNDLQGVGIVRRNPENGEVESEQASLAFKFHGFVSQIEYDLLAARHFGDNLLGIGGIVSVGGSIWRGDITWTDTGQDTVLSGVASISHSWVLGGRNWSGLLEYYYNGFGQRDGAYSAVELAQNPDLVKRLERGELFTLARNYLVASTTIELTPLFLLSPNIFVNIEDPSSLLQIVSQYDWQQNLQITAAINIPIGPDGSEYGGIEAPKPGTYFSTALSLFAQLAWYF